MGRKSAGSNPSLLDSRDVVVVVVDEVFFIIMVLTVCRR